jgi:hypothetical protein
MLQPSQVYFYASSTVVQIRSNGTEFQMMVLMMLYVRKIIKCDLKSAMGISAEDKQRKTYVICT